MIVLVHTTEWVGMLDDDDGGLSISLLNLLSRPCPLFLPQIIITTQQLFQAYTINCVILLIVLYKGAVLVRMTWYTDDSVTTIHDDDDVVMMSVLYVRCHEYCIVQWEPYKHPCHCPF